MREYRGGARTPAAYAEKARAVVGRGYRALKFDPFGTAWKDLTAEEAELAVETVAAIREAYDDFVRRGQIIPVAEQARGAGARKASQRASGVDASAAPGLDEARV